MQTLDLHELKADDAIKYFLSEYENYQKAREAFRLVHGYGSSGEGGKIMRKVRQILQDNADKLKYTCGEDIDGNPGYTIVYPNQTMALFTDLLAQEILEFCEVSKVQGKILSKFRKHGDSNIIRTLKNLEKSRMIKAGTKGLHKTWTKI